MSHEKLTELCSIYALGALDGEELREFEAHLKGGCRRCEEQVREYATLVASIPEALPNVAPSADVKDRLLAKLDKEFRRREVVSFSPYIGPPAKPQKSIWLAWACAAAATVAFVVSLADISQLNRSLGEQQESLRQQIEQLKVLQKLLEDEKEVSRFIRKPDTRVTALAGTAKSPQSFGKVIWSAQERKAFFYASNLPVIPAEKTYQLWIIAANKPFDAGIFSVDPEGNAFVRVDSLFEADKAQKFAVTLEPAGGVAQPTGEMHLLGSL
jgi:anti-sigma-K factor RskA